MKTQEQRRAEQEEKRAEARRPGLEEVSKGSAEVEKLTEQREKIQARYNQAQAELRAIRQEIAEWPQSYKNAHKTDQDAIRKAAKKGSLKGVKTPTVEKVVERGQELPVLVWAKETEVLELALELAEAADAEFEPRAREAAARVEALEERHRQTEKKLLDARHEWTQLIETRRTLTEGHKHNHARLQQLEEEGPDFNAVGPFAIR